MSDKKYTQQVLDQIYTYHKPSEESSQVMATIREKAKDFAQYIVDNCPDERETSIALQKLEEASFFANASISRHAPHEEETK